MSGKWAIAALASGVVLWGQSSGALVVNLKAAKWSHEAGDPPGAESIVLREDARTGALELLARYPGGHVFKPHWHSANERIVLLEGRLALRRGAKETVLEPGGFAYLPAREAQRMACVSKERCTFYVHWDGKLDFHAAPPEQ